MKEIIIIFIFLGWRDFFYPACVDIIQFAWKGQHLISAIFEQDFNHETIAWSLGPDVSYIEFKISNQVTADEIAAVEKKCNDLVAQAIPVEVQILNAENTDLKSPEVGLFFWKKQKISKIPKKTLQWLIF